MEEGLNFSPFSEGITLSPLALVAVLVFGGMMLVVPRRWALAPLFTCTLLISQSQHLPIGPLHFGITRLMVLFGWARLLIHGEFSGFRWMKLDRAVIIWAVVGTLLYIS